MRVPIHEQFRQLSDLEALSQYRRVLNSTRQTVEQSRDLVRESRESLRTIDNLFEPYADN